MSQLRENKDIKSGSTDFREHLEGARHGRRVTRQPVTWTRYWYQVPGTWNLLESTWYAPGRSYIPVPGTRYQAGFLVCISTLANVAFGNPKSLYVVTPTCSLRYTHVSLALVLFYRQSSRTCYNQVPGRLNTGKTILYILLCAQEQNPKAVGRRILYVRYI